MKQVNYVLPPTFDEFRQSAEFREFLDWLPALAARYGYSPRMVALVKRNPTPEMVLLAVCSLSFNLYGHYWRLSKQLEAEYFADRSSLVLEANEGAIRNVLYQALIQGIVLELPAFLRRSRTVNRLLQVFVPPLATIGFRFIGNLGFRYAFASAE
ncbi:MAG: hypothetical protein H8E40_14960 [Chloroflexi bacterium]|nr:hypothetical protein [Chloroflexota bacterium]